jgi:hypothetical protein
MGQVRGVHLHLNTYLEVWVPPQSTSAFSLATAGLLNGAGHSLNWPLVITGATASLGRRRSITDDGGHRGRFAFQSSEFGTS